MWGDIRQSCLKVLSRYNFFHIYLPLKASQISAVMKRTLQYALKCTLYIWNWGFEIGEYTYPFIKYMYIFQFSSSRHIDVIQ